jgi:hypothetical protein
MVEVVVGGDAAEAVDRDTRSAAASVEQVHEKMVRAGQPGGKNLAAD